MSKCLPVHSTIFLKPIWLAFSDRRSPFRLIFSFYYKRKITHHSRGIMLSLLEVLSYASCMSHISMKKKHVIYIYVVCSFSFKLLLCLFISEYMYILCLEKKNKQKITHLDYMLYKMCATFFSLE